MKLDRTPFVLIITIALFVLSHHLIGQEQLVKEKKLYNELYSYLISHSNLHLYDEHGIPQPDSLLFPRSTGIACGSVKTDSVIPFKAETGIYQFRFTCSNCVSYFFFYFSNGKKVFYNIYEKGFDDWRFIEKAKLFLIKNCSSYTKEEKLRSLKAILDELLIKSR